MDVLAMLKMTKNYLFFAPCLNAGFSKYAMTGIQIHAHDTHGHHTGTFG